jgi:hypothetical protein
MTDDNKTNKTVFRVKPEFYRQLDFLRLFRLGKNLGFVNNARKMPSSYHDDAHSRSACRMLLRYVIKGSFPNCKTVCEITSNYSGYYVMLSKEAKDAFSHFNRMTGLPKYRDTSDPVYLDALHSYNSLINPDGLSDNEFIVPRFPFSVRIRFTLQTEKVSSFISKPAESFYRCALDCVKYAEDFDKHVDAVLKSVQKDIDDTEKEKKAQRKRKKKAAPSKQQTVDIKVSKSVKTESADLKSFSSTITEEKDTRVRNAQSNFDRALSEYLDRR